MTTPPAPPARSPDLPAIYAKDYDGPPPLILSHSSDGTYESCHRKFELYKLYQNPARDASPNSFSLAAEVGKCLHEAYQCYLVTRDHDKAAQRLLETYPIKNNIVLWDDIADRGLPAAYATLQALINSPALIEFDIATIRDVSGELRSAVEIEFDIVLEDVYIAGRPVVWNGFMDMIMFNHLKGIYTVNDLKTTRNYRTNNTAKYAQDGQCVPYGIILQHVLQQELHEFNVRYLHTFIDLLEPRVDVYTFPKGSADIEDWFTGLCFKIKEMQTFASAKHWPRTQHGCDSIYGGECKYFQGVCQSRDPQTVQNLILMDHQTPAPQRLREPWIIMTLAMPESLKNE